MPDIADDRGVPPLIGDSSVIQAVREGIASAARTAAKVLILGETGVGKEVVSRLIHAQSARSSRAFVAVNCSGIPETLLESELFGHVRGSFTGAYRDKSGLIQQAHRGTLFLDELGEMSLRMQAILLRFAETGEVQRVGADSGAAKTDVRLITATNRDLRAQIAAGAFREDLYYRLNVIQIWIPPLRERGDDIILLFDHYLARAAAAHGLPRPSLTPEATQVLLNHAWPGNVRELRNITERLVLRDCARPVTPDTLPPELRDARAPKPLPRPVAPEQSPSPVSAAQPADHPVTDRVLHVWQRLQNGEDFWTAVHQPFKARELTKIELATVVDLALRETRGSYRGMLRLFHLDQSEYKRLHAFLYQQGANLPVAPYRNQAVSATRRA